MNPELAAGSAAGCVDTTSSFPSTWLADRDYKGTCLRRGSEHWQGKVGEVGEVDEVDVENAANWKQ